VRALWPGYSIGFSGDRRRRNANLTLLRLCH
jgi:hypothetical protein